MLYSAHVTYFGGQSMAVPNREVVQWSLSRLEAQLQSIVMQAWQDWLESPESARLVYSRTRASFVWDRMVALAKDRLLTLPGVACYEKDETVSFAVDDTVLFRFKKGDARGMSRNYPTQTALTFHDPQQVFPGFPELVRVDVVYVLNQLETRVERVLVVARNGGRKLWDYALVVTAISAAPSLLVEESSVPVEKLVRLRHGDRSQEQAEQQ